MEEKIRAVLEERASGGTISCSEARKIAEELGVKYSEVGTAADKLRIKIKDCELGCF